MIEPEGQVVVSQSKARDLSLLGCDEFQQSWLSFLRCGDPTLDRRDNVLWLFDPFAVATKSPRHSGVVAGDVGAAILLCADRHYLQLDGHGEVVQKDGENRDALAHRRLEVHPREANRCIAPNIDAKFVWRRQLRTHPQSHPLT